MSLKCVAYLATAAIVCGCSADHDEYTVRVETEGHAVYKISRPGGLIPAETFDVVLVHGFNDNRLVGQQIVDLLNQQEPGTYTLSEVER